MRYEVDVIAVGLRELRQNASELVRRVESGEEIEITVAGRPGARLVPSAAPGVANVRGDRRLVRRAPRHGLASRPRGD